MTDPTRFEDCHRELRAALSPTVAGLADQELAEFDRLVGPLVDDLVAAVREKGHAEECRGKDEGMELCDCPMSALAALDEAARG